MGARSRVDDAVGGAQVTEHDVAPGEGAAASRAGDEVPVGGGEVGEAMAVEVAEAGEDPAAFGADVSLGPGSSWAGRLRGGAGHSWEVIRLGHGGGALPVCCAVRCGVEDGLMEGAGGGEVGLSCRPGQTAGANSRKMHGHRRCGGLFAGCRALKVGQIRWRWLRCRARGTT